MIHTYLDDGEWKVFLGFAISEHTVNSLGKDRLEIDAFILHEKSLKFIGRMQHYNSLASAHYFVWFPERDIMFNDIKEDVEKRYLWKERLDQYEKIMQGFGIITTP